MNISRTSNDPILIQMDPQFSANATKVQIANAVAVKQAKVNKEVAQTAIDLLETASQIGSSQATGRGIDVRA
jgi:hypothetical protein